MGTITRILDRIKKGPQAPNSNIFDAPVSGGDIFETQKRLEAYMSGNPNKWWWYTIFRSYFENLYNIDGDDELNEIWPYLMCLKLDYGVVGLTKVDGQLAAVGIKNVNPVGINGWEGEGYILNTTFAFYGMAYNMFEKDKQTVKINNENCVMFKDNIHNLPAYWYMSAMIDDFLDYMDIVKTCSRFMAKKIIWNIKNGNSDVLEDEFSSMYDLTTGYLINIGDDDIGYNGFTPGRDDVDTSGLSNKMKVLDTPPDGAINALLVVEKWCNLYFGMVGRISNHNDKKERVISGEIERSAEATNIVAERTIKFVRRGVDDYNKILGGTAILTVVTDEIAEEADNMDNGGDNPTDPNGGQNDTNS